MKVPFLDLSGSNRDLKAEILPLWEEILDGAGFVGGAHVAAFEEAFAAACGVGHCVSTASGTDALFLIFQALGLGPGDEVITVPNTFIATAEAIAQAGGTPVFVDVDPETYLMDPERLESAITPKTRGIVPVHLYGQTADMDPILSAAKRNGLWVVEDACQAHLAEYRGKKAGSMGIAGAFSFYPGKNLGGCGEGGAVTTRSPELADRIRMLRDHGQSRKYVHQVEGTNARCDALQAAALGVKLPHLVRWNEARRKNAELYNRLLRDADGIVVPVVRSGCISVFHLYVVLVEDRSRIQETLEKEGIGTGLHYPVPLHLQEAYRRLNIPAGRYPVVESCARRLLSLPMYPELSERQIHFVADALIRAVSAVAAQ